MKLVGVIILAGIVSLFAGLAVTIAGSALLPCYSDKAGCGMGDAYRIFFVPLYVIAGMIAFGFSAPGIAREQPVKRAMYTLLLAGVFLCLFSIVSDLTSGRSLTSGTVSEMIQIMSAFAAVIVTQWLMIGNYVRRRQYARKEAS